MKRAVCSSYGRGCWGGGGGAKATERTSKKKINNKERKKGNDKQIWGVQEAEGGN